MTPRRTLVTKTTIAFVSVSIVIMIAAACSPFGGSDDPIDTTTINDASAGDGTTPPVVDGGGSSDTAGNTGDGNAPDAFDPGPCGAGCPTGSTCDPTGCHVDIEPSCNAVGGITVPAGGARFYGEICAEKGSPATVCLGKADTKAHVFKVTGTADIHAEIGPRSNTLRVNVVDGTCSASSNMGCGTYGGSSNSTIPVDLTPPANLALGMDSAQGCVSYAIKFSAK